MAPATIARRLFIPDAPAGIPGQFLGINPDGTAGWITGEGGALQPSGADDTSNINAAIIASQPLASGTFMVGGVITGYPLGQGPGKTILQATSGAARIQGGPALGTLPTSDSGLYGNFTIDGMNIAGATNPLILVNTSGTTFLPVNATKGLGDGVIYAGQNCNFLNWNLAGFAGCSLALDNGCGGANFFGGRLANATQYHLEFRQSLAPPAGAFAVPENNNFYGITFEKGWPSGAPTNLGCLHCLAGVLNRLKYCSFYSGAGATRLAYFEPNTVAGRANDRNDLIFIEECFWTGSAGVVNAIECSATYAPIVGVSGDGLVLEGHQIMSAFTNGILWPGGMPLKDYGQIQCFNVTNPYNSTPLGTPLRRPRDRGQQQPGIYAPSVPGWTAAAGAVAANTAYFSRFVPSRDITINAVAFTVLVAAAANDQVDVGIYTEYNHQVVTAGLTAGLLNATGRKTLALSSSVTLLAGWIYYVCVATAALGGAPAQLAMASFGAGNNLFGASPGTAEVLKLAPIAAGGCPAAMAAGGGVTMTFPDLGGPAAAVLEAGPIGQ